MMTEGHHAGEFFVIIDGAVRVEKGGKPIKTLGPGEFLGEIALVDGGPRSATVTLQAPSRLLVLTRTAFHSLMDEFPSVRQSVLETLAQRVRGLERDAYH
jgi:CRP-like cAMP-binding protein